MISLIDRIYTEVKICLKNVAKYIMFNIFKRDYEQGGRSLMREEWNNANICETEIEGINYFVGRRETAKR